MAPPSHSREPYARRLRLCLPPRDSLAWLVVAPMAALAAATLTMWLCGVPGGDDPAHLYKVALLRSGESSLWDNLWYAGSYGIVTYGILFYWLARWVPIAVLVVLGAGLLPLLFHLYLLRCWGIAGRGPAWALAGVLVVYLAMGQSPFLVALCLVMGGLVLLGSGRPITAALLWSAAVFTNPLAIVAGGVFVLGDLAAHRHARRAILTFALALLPAVGARVVLGVVFSEPALEFRGLPTLARLLAFAALGVLLARAASAPPQRALQWVFAAFAAVVLVTFLVAELPVGSNVSRFFAVFGVPLLVAVAWPTRLPRWAPVVPVVAALAFQVQFPLWQLWEAERSWATQPSFYAPALALAARLHDPDHRVHVVAPEGHWEAYYFPVAGYPITRGWYRQADAIHNRIFYTPYDAGDYTAWLRRMGVRYVYLPDASLDPWSRREARILRTSPAFALVESVGSWEVYRLRDDAPLVEGLDGGSARVARMEHREIGVVVDSPGRYLLKVTWNPYWVLEGGPGTLRRGSDRFIVLDAGRPGPYTVRFEVTPGKALGQVAERLGL